MDLTQEEFQGFLQTPLIGENLIDGIKPFNVTSGELTRDVPNNLFLGKRAECFFASAVGSQVDFSIYAENLQIQKEKETLGEIDFILSTPQNGFIHVELAYKVYLFDSSVRGKWIGPNRKDLLVDKLEKLQNHQFPMVYSPFLNLEVPEGVVQALCLKAKLFVPHGEKVDLGSLNPDCVVGEYIRFEQLKGFEGEAFLPPKRNWPIYPVYDTPVKWKSSDSILSDIKSQIENKRSPMVWWKRNKVVKVFFVVWW